MTMTKINLNAAKINQAIRQQLPVCVGNERTSIPVWAARTRKGEVEVKVARSGHYTQYNWYTLAQLSGTCDQYFVYVE
jgi:hypothetical protein